MSSAPHQTETVTPSVEDRPKYDPLTIGLHWATVLLVLTQFATALSIDTVPLEWTSTVLQMHRSAGVLLWMLILFRVTWRLTGMRLPPFPPQMAPWHIFGVHLSESSLYGLLLLQPLTGMADTLLRGKPFPLWGREIPAILAKNLDLAADAHRLHELGAGALVALVGLHATAALFHHFILGDSVLRSMLPGTRKSRKRRLPA